jgi:hypothetical protein
MTFIVDALAVYRLTRLATRDTITEQLRETIEQEIGTLTEARIIKPQTQEKLVYLMGCDWCMSIWVATTALLLKRYVPDIWRKISYVAAASAVAGTLANNE